MATDQQHIAGLQPTEGLTIDEIPTVHPLEPSNELSQDDTPHASSEKANPPPYALPKFALPEIDKSSGPAMVTPRELLQREPAWIDCPFCKRMAETKVTLKEESEEPSGLMMCLVCLVCCPLLLCLPMMMGKTQSWIHTCSQCNSTVAIRGHHGNIDIKNPPPSKTIPSKYGAANHAPTVSAVAPMQNSAKAQ